MIKHVEHCVFEMSWHGWHISWPLSSIITQNLCYIQMTFMMYITQTVSMVMYFNCAFTKSSKRHYFNPHKRNDQVWIRHVRFC